MLDLVHSPQNARQLVHPALLAAEPVSIAILRIRLTRSKAFTDVIGPRYANAVLNVGIDRIKATLKQDDSLLRLDKDELVILLNPVHSARDAARMANEIIALLQRPYFCRGASARLEASAGVALSSSGVTDIDTLLLHAESALSYAKLSRSATAVLYDGELQARAQARNTLAHDLSRVLDSAQLRVHYQPQLSIDRQRLLGFSAQLRWKHPVLGWISPNQFIPLAEEIGMMHKLARWTLRTACMQAVSLRPELTVAVRCYPLQFAAGTFVATVTNALASAGLAAGRLAIELTENVLLDTSTTVQSTIVSLHSMGVKLVLADFEATLSSFDLITKAPFSAINMESKLASPHPQQRGLVRAATMLGKELGISTIAQGIETREDLTNAEFDGYTGAQGTFLGDFVPGSELRQVAATFAVRGAA